MKCLAALLLLLGLAGLAAGCAASPKPLAAVNAAPAGPAIYRNEAIAFKISCEERIADGQKVVFIEPLSANIQQIVVSSITFRNWSENRVSCHVDANLDYTQGGQPYYLANEFTAFARKVAAPARPGTKLIDLHLPEANFEIRYTGNVVFTPEFKRELNKLKLWETHGPVDFTAPAPMLARVSPR